MSLTHWFVCQLILLGVGNDALIFVACACVLQETENASSSKFPKCGRAVAHVGIPFQPRLEHHTTSVEPFSFDERDKLMFARKEEKIRTVLDEEKKVFFCNLTHLCGVTFCVVILNVTLFRV